MISSLFLAALPMLAPPPMLQDEHPTDHPTGDHPKAKVVDLDDQFDALEEELGAAVEAWWAKYSAGQEAGVPEDELPVYPADSFRPKFAVIAKAGHFDAQMWMIGNAAWEDTAGRLTWLERILTDNTNHPDLGDLFRSMTWNFRADEPALFRLLDTFIGTTEVAAHGFDAKAVKGLILVQSGTKEQKATGLAILKEMTRISRAFPMQERIVSAIFIAENLQIGMVAPNFEAVDVDGAPVSLADYRGKVTVLDFWGFW